ncbi:phosphopantetheine-binding protein [Streptomyces sp. NPDC048496]|uniref:phosphopantetheine-binding protein n=1 Tax=Streptomyces sp. NPDC048496 TaxID=3365558 RepID=UPI00371ABFA0
MRRGGRSPCRTFSTTRSPAAAGEPDAPRSRLEAALADIWADVFGLDEVGVHDDFHDLGGHSLLAVRITNRVRDELGFPLTVRGLFEHPTIEELSRLIDGTGAEH